MKRFLLSAIIATMVLSTTNIAAQDRSNVRPLRWQGFETNRFWDNWEVSAAGGNSFLLLSNGKVNKDPGKFFDRNGWNANVAATKWVVPVLGMRLQLDAGEFRNYSFEPATYGESAFKTPYIFVHGDILVNMSNWIGGYNPNRIYSAVSYVGFGYTAMSWTNASAGSYNGEYAFTSGLLNKFRITPQWDIELDLRSWIFPEQSLPAEIRSGGRYAFAMSASLGVAYRFNQRDWQPAYSQLDVDGYIAAIVALEEELIATDEMLGITANHVNSLTAENERLRGELQSTRSHSSEAEEVVVAESVVFFNIGESTLTDYAKATLDQYITVAAESNAPITITGYADKETGSSSRNEVLSHERAEITKRYLVAAGIAPERITTQWVGDTEAAFHSPNTPIVNRCAIIK